MANTKQHHIDIFVPQHFYENLPVYLFGLYTDVSNAECFVNCTISADCYNIKSLPTLRHLVRTANDGGTNKACLGLLYYENSDHETRSSELKKFKCPVFFIEVGENKKTKFLNWDIFSNKQTPSSSIIMYNSYDLYSAELVISGVDNSFVNFLCDTWTTTETIAQNSGHEFSFEDCQFCVEPATKNYFRGKILNCLTLVLTLLCNICDCWTQRVPHFAQKVLSMTTTGKQLACKSRHFKAILTNLSQHKKITLLSGNLLSALIFDAVCGLLLTCFFREYLQPVTLIEAVIDKTDVVVSHLQELLHWLMGVPAGLKLNLPLNSVLGRFFLYHIYLWKTYIVLIKPLLLAMLEFSMHFGVLGLSFLISLCTDFISLATLHIYCFYGYAARIYSIKLSGLVAFWRLFRGKKWNPLRNRVDSFTYDVQQLFLGTLIFTVTVFLLPTVALYYAVFAMLRMLVLFLQVLLCKIVDVLTQFPLYTLFLNFSDHPFVKGDVCLKAISSITGTVFLSLQVISIPVKDVLQRTLPNERFCTDLSFKAVLNDIIFGRVIYPL